MKLAKAILEEIIEPENSLDIGRDEMPQIDSEDTKEFLKYLKSVECDYERCKKKAKDLKPSQNELDTDKAEKRCIDDKIVEFKLAEKYIRMFEEEPDTISNIQNHLVTTGYENIYVDDYEIDEENEVVILTIADSENNEIMALFFKDEELGHVVSVIESADEIELDELDVMELQDLNPPTLPSGLIDFSQDLAWLSEDVIDSLLSFGDQSDDGEEIEERTITVIRKGKKVRKQVKRKIRKKRLTAKRKMAIRRGVKKRKLKKIITQRKRKKSLTIRKRSKLKRKPKNLRVVG